MELIVSRHYVGQNPESGLSPLQQALVEEPAKVRIANAPTGAGKSYAFERAMIDKDHRILFIVPTRRLCQNLAAGLMEALVDQHGWPEKAAAAKVALWNSDETRRLKEIGEINIGARRIREIYALDPTRQGGEMIIAVPEVVSCLLLRYRLDKGQADAGVFDLLRVFDHIVFDEFHTISPRGFGLAGLLAKLAVEFSESSAKVSFLSATPLDIQPVLERLGIPQESIAELKEELTEQGRAVHGDVRLSLCECAGLPDLLESQIDAMQAQIKRGRQVVIIYNALADLQRHLPRMEKILRQAGIKKGRSLVIDSIDDSRTHNKNEGFFAMGRYLSPDRFDVLIATASVEMGVTFRSDFLVMEPGFEAMNFLQRYGRAARGDHDGCVLVRFDKNFLKKNVWFRRFKKWVEKHEGQKVNIDELTDVLSRNSREQFKDCPREGRSYFGKLPNRAAFTAGLYWNLLMGHLSNKGHRWKHLKEHQPKPAKQIFGLLKQVRQMESDVMIGHSVKEWCDRFEQEARTLRDIGTQVRVVEEDGEMFRVQELWLRRNTDILDRFPLLVGEDGLEEVKIKGDLSTNLLDEKQFVKSVRSVRFPHTAYVLPLKDDSFLVKEWCREFCRKEGVESMMWDLYPAAMEAAEKLVSLTGLVVSDDSKVDASSGVL